MSGNNSSGRRRRELTRQGDERAKRATQAIAEMNREKRQPRVCDAANPIGTYLTLIKWFQRWLCVCVVRHLQGKNVPSYLYRDEKDWYTAHERGGDWHHIQLARLKRLREAVLVEGCRLGATAGEMSDRLTEGEYCAVRMRCSVGAVLGGEEECAAVSKMKEGNIWNVIKLLNDLLVLWNVDRGQIPGTTPVRRMSKEEANRRAMELLQQNPSFAQLTTEKFAALIPCSVGLAHTLPAWQAVLATTGRTRDGRAARPKAVSLTKNLENSIGKPDEELQRLIQDQAADDKRQKIHPRGRI